MMLEVVQYVMCRYHLQPESRHCIIRLWGVEGANISDGDMSGSARPPGAMSVVSALAAARRSSNMSPKTDARDSTRSRAENALGSCWEGRHVASKGSAPASQQGAAGLVTAASESVAGVPLPFEAVR
jgi:hypothetical protein